MRFEEDPEVVADLKLRAATEHDRSRSREMPVFAPSPTIARVPCRGRCGITVEWSEDAEDRFRMFNRILAAKSDAPLDKTRIVFCRVCASRGSAGAAENNRQKVDAMAKWIRELKADPSPNGERERELLEKLKPHHPDLDGLTQAIKTRRETSSSKHGRVRRGSL